LSEVRARLIGTHGKTRNTLQQVADCEILVTDDAVGLICRAEEIDKATTAVSNLIKGSKQANVYRFLERMNAEKKKLSEDLGIKRENKEDEQNEEESE
jgi:rRNA processing protein Krr1/Pno1